MKTERDKVIKKVWEKPVIVVLSLKNTYNGFTPGPEQEFYTPS